MAEFTNALPQTVALGANVIFTENPVKACPCVRHRDGSGLFTFRGGHKYLVVFSGNISGATAGTEVDLAITIGGEEIPSTRMAATPAAAEDLNNVAAFIELEVPSCCCYNVSVENVGTTALTVANANLVIFRED